MICCVFQMRKQINELNRSSILFYCNMQENISYSSLQCLKYQSALYFSWYSSKSKRHLNLRFFWTSPHVFSSVQQLCTVIPWETSSVWNALSSLSLFSLYLILRSNWSLSCSFSILIFLSLDIWSDWLVFNSFILRFILSFFLLSTLYLLIWCAATNCF